MFRLLVRVCLLCFVARELVRGGGEGGVQGLVTSRRNTRESEEEEEQEDYDEAGLTTVLDLIVIFDDQLTTR